MDILIVEDELILAHTMEAMLKNLGYTGIAVEPSFSGAKELLGKNKYRMVILDINLGEGNEGIELAGICNGQQIPFIYTSSYTDRHTLDKALQKNPGSYLIKPVTEMNLYTSIRILLEQKSSGAPVYLEFKDGVELIRLPLDQLLYLKSENIYVNVVTKDKTYLYRGSLASLMERVPSGKIIQTHRAYAVNSMHVNRISATYVYVAGQEIPISRSYKHLISKE